MGVYVKSVKTNVKKIQNIELGPKTLIVGKNGSGKSSILNSIELCFGGYVSDYRGKIVKLPRDLHPLSAESDLTVQCTLSDDTTKSYSIKMKKDKTISRPTVYGKTSLSLPMQDISEILEGSSKRFKTWLLSLITPNIDKKDFEIACQKAQIDPALFEMDNLIISVENQIESNKLHIKSLGDLIRSRKKTIKDFSQTIDRSVDLNSITEYERVNKSIEEFEKSRSIIEDSLIKIKSLTHQVKEAKSKYSIIKGKLDTITQHSELLPTRNEILEDNLRKDIIEIFDLQAQLGQTDNCLICDNKIEHFHERRDKLHSDKADLENKIELLKIKARLEEECKNATDEVEELERSLSNISDSISGTNQFNKKLENCTEDIGSLRDRLSVLKVKKDAVQVYKLRIKELERVKDELKEMEKNHQDAKKLVASLEKIQTEFVWEAKDKFTDKIEEFLSYKIELEIGEKSINIGKLAGPNKVYPGLSGAEYLELKLALAQALYPSDSIIMSEDRAVDEATLIRIMEKVSTLSNQVILTSVFTPSTIPQDWLVVEL